LTFLGKTINGRKFCENVFRNDNGFIPSRFATIGAEPLASTPEEYAADIDREETKWSTLIKSLGLKAE
jgi:hypothetical protein